MGARYVVLAEVPPTGLAAFAAYEDTVLPFLGDHGGRLEQRLRYERDDGGWTEVHILSFAGEAGLASYRKDPRRAVVQPLLASSGATVRLLPVEDVLVTAR